MIIMECLFLIFSTVQGYHVHTSEHIFMFFNTLLEIFFATFVAEQWKIPWVVVKQHFKGLQGRVLPSTKNGM